MISPVPASTVAVPSVGGVTIATEAWSMERLTMPSLFRTASRMRPGGAMMYSSSPATGAVAVITNGSTPVCPLLAAKYM
jgi:hypothetical protein